MRTDEKNLEYLRLLDAYGGLLTGRQKDVCELYYMYDLSLTEIAEQKGISKQSVSDTLAKSRALMDEYEAKLHFNELNLKYSLEISRKFTRIARAAEAFKRAHPEFSAEMDEILDLVREDGENEAPDEKDV